MSSISIYSEIPVTQSKTCTKCSIYKTLTEFSKSKKGKYGYRSECKLCVKEYQLSNTEYTKSYYREYQKANKGKMCAYTANYRASKLSATPVWVEIDLIDKLYENCISISESFGIEHHVDHIVPLQSDIVCGLHCIANLQILTATENHSKSNSYWPDMWQ